MKQNVAITNLDTGRDYTKDLDEIKQYGFNAEHIKLEGTSDEKTVISSLKGFDFILAGPELYNKRVLEGLSPELKMISRLGTGVDKIDLDAAACLGIVVANTPGTNACSVAQHTLALMMDLSFNVSSYDRGVRTGKYRRRTANDLIDKTIGFIGYGQVSRYLTKLLKGFGTRIMYYDIKRQFDSEDRDQIQFAEIDKLLGFSDYVSLHLPLTDETRRMADIDFFLKMKSSAFFINTSRGGIVVEKDLISALKNGVIAGAGLDVYEKWPLEPGNELLSIDNVVLTPYVAFSSEKAEKETFASAFEKIKQYLKTI